MKKTNHSFSEYINNSKALFIALYGQELFDKLNNAPLKSINWNGLDVDESGIVATFPNIQKRFTPEWIEYFEEHNGNLFELFLQSVFHYGYQQHSDTTPSFFDFLKHNKT